jgi:sarcosine oxidase
VSYDIIVAGLGAMGSATAFHLAGRKGLRILALDRHHPPHTLGSTHGGTRIIRETSFEHPRYVPLVRRAYQCWRQIEAVTGRPLLRITGGLFVGPPDGPFVARSKASADVHGVPYEILAASEIRRRFPAFRPEEGTVGFLEPGAGILGPEACVQACLDHAASRGVELRFDEPLERWDADGNGVAVTTARGRYTAAKLLLATGPWMPGPVARVDVPLTVERIVMHWFAPAGDPALFDAAQCPLALWEFEPGAAFASFPLDEGRAEIKMTVHHGGERTTPDTVRREVGAAEVAGARSLIARFLPGANGAHRRSAVCLYTNTPSGDFLITAHPDHSQVLVASPCSGFGFKFASAIGELLADLLVEGKTKWDLEPFGLARTRATSPARDTPPTSGPRAPSRPD